MDSPDHAEAVRHDRVLLATLFGELEELLGWAVDYRSRLLPSDVADRVVPAWESVRPNFGAVQSALLASAVRETRAEEASLVQADRITDAQLRAYGLRGDQLKLKVETFLAAKDAFYAKHRTYVEEGGPLTRVWRWVVTRLNWPSAKDRIS